MMGSRPEQAVLSRNSDMSKTAETGAVVEGMVCVRSIQNLTVLQAGG